MDNQQAPNQNKNLEVASKTNLLPALAAGDKYKVNEILRLYKTDKGGVNHPAILSIPRSERLPELAKNDYNNILTIISAALTLCFEGMNLKRGMSAGQIVDLAEAIIDSSNEDWLAMEDVMLFLQKLNRGEYGAMYESMDIPKFMLAFEEYREDRHKALMEIRENKNAEFKGMGNGERSVQKEALDEHFFSMANQLSNLKDALKETRKENKKLKDIDNF